MQMEGRVAIVTGGSGQIGSVVTAALVEEGANVVIASRHQASSTTGATYVPTDLAKERAVENLVDRTVALHGRVDALFNVAGGFRYGPPVDETSEADWDAMMQLNLKSTFLAIKHVLPVMKRQGCGEERPQGRCHGRAIRCLESRCDLAHPVGGR